LASLGSAESIEANGGRSALADSCIV
jgi:hypothetical protein